MKKGSVKLLQMIAVGLQAVTLVITLGMTAVQGTIKTLFTYSEEVVEVVSVPMDALLWTILLLVVYVAGMLVVWKTEEKATKVKAGVLVGIACLFQILSQYTGTVMSSLIAMQGVNALASYSALKTIIVQATTPFIWSAFALFCLSCGGYVELEKQSSYIG